MTDPFAELLADAGFPAAPAWASVQERVRRPEAERDQAVWVEFVGGWLAVAYRFFGLRGEAAILRDSLGKPSGDAPPPRERAFQEHHLYVFYAVGLSALESHMYALHAIASLLDPRRFQLEGDEDRRRVRVESTLDGFKEAFPSEALTAVIAEVFDKRGSEFETYDDWRLARNGLSHRASPPRNISLTLGAESDRSARWMDAPLSQTRISKLEQWISAHLGNLVIATDTFVQARFPSGPKDGPDDR